MLCGGSDAAIIPIGIYAFQFVPSWDLVLFNIRNQLFFSRQIQSMMFGFSSHDFALHALSRFRWFCSMQSTFTKKR